MIQELILGSHVIKTESQKRKIVLGAFLILTYLGVDLFFFVVNFFNAAGEPLPLFIGILVSFVGLVLLRYQQTNAAMFLHLIRANVMAFYFSMVDEDPLQTGVYIFFIPSCLGALAVFGYRQRWVGIAFTILSVVLFLVAIFDPTRFSPNDAHFYVVVNFLIALLIGMLIILYFDLLVISSEKENLNKNAELTKINSELDRFVYSVSHDLRAPLSSISGLIQLLEKSNSPTETSQYIGLMKGRIERLEHFIRDIINFSRNARAEVNQEIVNIKDMLEETFDALKYIKGADVITLHDELPDSLNMQIDKTRLQIVLFNIISNAIQYMDVNKAEPYIRFRCQRTDNWLILEIDDNGIGIDGPHLEKVFNMFYRATDQSKGSGLGLYIVKETVSKLEGTIALYSALGEGTRFVVTLPLQRN